MDSSATIPVTLKWNKKTFQLTIELGETAESFKQRVQSETGVPVARQKLTAKKAWKGFLKDGMVLDANNIRSQDQVLTVTLIGSAEKLTEPTQKTTFLEDLSPEDLRAAEDAKAQAAMADAQGMIQALQLPPHLRDDQKQYNLLVQYNRLVTGLPQRQIELELKATSSSNTTDRLQGKVAMNLGLELRRGYVNDLAVLLDGTLVSALDDGHVQLWKHAAQEQDMVHQGNIEGGVDSVVALNRGNSPVAFATAGRGTLQLWSADADPIVVLPGAMPGTSPASLECVFGSANDNEFSTATNVSDTKSRQQHTTCLATRFQITRQSNPAQFRLPPQNEAERQRRAQAEAQEQAIQESLARAARSLQVWFSVEEAVAGASSKPSLKTQILEPPVSGLGGAAPITSLATLRLARKGRSEATKILVAGDASGGLRLWKVQLTESGLQFHHHGMYQLIVNNSSNHFCSVVCMEALQDGRLAVSTDVTPANPGQQLEGATLIPIQASRAVHIFDFSQAFDNQIPLAHQTALTGHTKDAVICMCQLPNGDLLTGGGKLDATLQLWSQSQTQRSGVESESTDETGLALQTNSTKTLTDVGYVFSLTVLPDAKHDSDFFAVAAGRYNTVKIII